MKTFNGICVALLCSMIWQNGLAVQTGPPNAQGPNDPLARFSFNRTYLAGDESKQQHSPRICFELYRSGRYRISRMTKGSTENIGGVLSEGQLGRVTTMLSRLDFDNSRGGVIRKGSESFAAEIVRDDQTTRYIWVDPDHRRPFPDSAVSIINWLQGFAAQDASPITVPELSTDPICPRISDKPVQPVAASVHRSCGIGPDCRFALPIRASGCGGSRGDFWRLQLQWNE
jgi:hypothetical protein